MSPFQPQVTSVREIRCLSSFMKLGQIKLPLLKALECLDADEECYGEK